jgi:sigma-E factor negative regulatory protein RseA
MTQTHREDLSSGALSAGMDGELAREELRFLLRRLDHDASLGNAWTRFHLIRDSLRRELPRMASADFAARVQQAIEHEAAGVEPRGAYSGAGRLRHWLRWSAGGAIAAGVAVAALMLVQPAGEGSNNARLSAEAGADATPDQAIASAVLQPQPTTPAAVPPWLSNASASQYSQQAAATLGESYGDATLPYARSLSPYRLQTVRSASNPGGYLLLIDPQAPPAPRTSISAQ